MVPVFIEVNVHFGFKKTKIVILNSKKIQSKFCDAFLFGVKKCV
jgi:hypothetical protein